MKRIRNYGTIFSLTPSVQSVCDYRTPHYGVMIAGKEGYVVLELFLDVNANFGRGVTMDRIPVSYRRLVKPSHKFRLVAATRNFEHAKLIANAMEVLHVS